MYKHLSKTSHRWVTKNEMVKWAEISAAFLLNIPTNSTVWTPVAAKPMYSGLWAEECLAPACSPVARNTRSRESKEMLWTGSEQDFELLYSSATRNNWQMELGLQPGGRLSFSSASRPSPHPSAVLRCPSRNPSSSRDSKGLKTP